MKNIPKRPEPFRKEIPYCWKSETMTGDGHNGIFQVLTIFYFLILDAGSADVCQLLSDCLLAPNLSLHPLPCNAGAGDSTIYVSAFPVGSLLNSANMKCQREITRLEEKGGASGFLSALQFPCVSDRQYFTTTEQFLLAEAAQCRCSLSNT